MTFSLLHKISSLQTYVEQFLDNQRMGKEWVDILSVIINIILLLIICWVSYLIIRRITIIIISKRRIRNREAEKIDIFRKKKTFKPVAYLAPGFFIFYLTPTFFNLSSSSLKFIRVLVVIYIICMIMMMIVRILKSIEEIALNSEKYEGKPIGSYVQMAILISYIICGVLLLSILIGQSPLTILTAFGAGMAIIVLVFKDTVLGLIASIQISVNDMVRLGDWVEVPNYNADGDLIEINLMSIKVRNWDKSVTNVPTYALISNGFKNWREMQDLGIRRFLQYILIDINTIKKADDTLIEKLKEKKLLNEDVKNLKWVGEKDYKQEKVNTLTNLGLFRKYMEGYLQNHPGISEMYIVVNHKQQTGNGLPLEIYAFSKNVNYKPLQELQADIFEHFYSVIKEFDLAIFQNPTGEDLLKFKPSFPLTMPQLNKEK